MNNKNIISPRGRDFLLCRRRKRYAELTGNRNCKIDRIKSLSDNKLIGRFSCLSVSKLANITSFYNGKAYYYVMNMDIDQLHIDKVYELDTAEPNGVEVKIPLQSFDTKALECLGFIENVYVQQEGYSSYDIDRFNKRKIGTYKNFKTIQYEYRVPTEKTEILLGKIPYSVDYSSLWEYGDAWHMSWEDTMKYIYPCINIGEVDITPNRETLLYSDRTKKKLQEVYDACIDELVQQWKDKCNKEFEDFNDWAREITQYRDNQMDLGGIQVPISKQLPYDAKYKNHTEWDNIPPQEKKNIVRGLLNTTLDTLGTFSSGTLYKGRRDTYTSYGKLLGDWAYNKDRVVLVVPAQNGFSSKYFKDFLDYTYPNRRIILIRRQKVSVANLKSFIRRTYSTTIMTDKILMPFIVSLLIEFYRVVSGKVIYKDIINSPEYKQFKKDNQTPKNRISQHTGKITFTINSTDGFSSSKYTTTLADIVKHIKNAYGKKRIVYAELDSPFINAFYQMKYPNLVIISAAKNNMKYLQTGLPEYIRPIEELYRADNKILIKYKTIQSITIKNKEHVDFTYFKVMPSHLRKDFIKLKSYIDTYNVYCRYSCSPDSAAYILDIIPDDVYDIEIMGEYNKLLPYLKLSYELSNKLNGYSNNPLQYYILMKAKKIRLDYAYYKEVKEQVNYILSAL